MQVVGGVERTDEPSGEDLVAGVFVPLFRFASLDSNAQNPWQCQGLND